MKMTGTGSIKKFVADWINKHSSMLNGSTFVELPAGKGEISKVIESTGAQLECYDLLPGAFEAEGIECHHADLNKSLPIKSEYADFVLCQEGVEHIPNQFNLMLEFNRILKSKGRLLVTTPNYSNLLSRVSYLLSESERYKMMAPNVLDTVWFPDGSTGVESLYFGHAFLIGIHKLRFLARLAGFEIVKIHYTKCSHTSLILFPLLYPFIYLANRFAYKRVLKRNKAFPKDVLSVYTNNYKLSINPKILLDKTLFIEFEKVSEPVEHLRDHFKYARPPA